MTEARRRGSTFYTSLAGQRLHGVGWWFGAGSLPSWRHHPGALAAHYRYRGEHRARRPSEDRPAVFFRCGMWMRSGHYSTYDAWPVLAPLNDYQRKLVAQ